MTEEQKKQVATFRFGVIHELVNTKELSRGEQERLIRDKCARRWSIPFSNRTRIGRTTILRWIRLYKGSNGRFESLVASSRSDRGASRSMDEETSLSLIGLRDEFPRITISALISKMREANPGVKLNASGVNRLLKREGLVKPAQVRGRVRKRDLAIRCDARPDGKGRGEDEEDLPYSLSR